MINFSENREAIVELPLTVVDQWISARKMLWSDLSIPARQRGDTTLRISNAQFYLLTSILKVPAETLLGASSTETKAKNVSVISRKGEGYIRCAARNGVPYYRYHHLVTTELAPKLMPLLIDVLFDNEKAPVMNIHSSDEVAVILSGTVFFHSETLEGNVRTEMNEGDSVFIAAETKHSFTRISSKAQILAINF